MASYLICLVERYTGQMAVKFPFPLITDNVEILYILCALLHVCVGCVGAKHNFQIGARFYFFWKHSWILNIYLIK
jgi:hypothetical protein